MTLVLDASVALKWFLIEEGSAEALRLVQSGHPLIAPDLIIPEVCNGAWKSARLGRLVPAQVDIVVAAIPKYFAEFIPSITLAERAVALARSLDHAVFDCFYLALAEVRSTTLVTADARLLARIQASPWQTQVVSLR